MMAVMPTTVVGCNDRVNDAGRELAPSPSAATLAPSLRAMSFWRRVHHRVGQGWAPVTALALWGLGLCRTHTTLTVLPAVTPLSSPRLAAGLFPQPRASAERAGLCPSSSHSLAGLGAGQQHVQSPACLGGVTVGTSGICSFPCTSDGRWLLCFHVHGE